MQNSDGDTKLESVGDGNRPVGSRGEAR